MTQAETLWEVLREIIAFEGEGRCALWKDISYNVLTILSNLTNVQSFYAPPFATELILTQNFLTANVPENNIAVVDGDMLYDLLNTHQTDNRILKIPDTRSKTLVGAIKGISDEIAVLDGTADQNGLSGLYRGRTPKILRGGFYAPIHCAPRRFQAIYKEGLMYDVPKFRKQKDLNFISQSLNFF